MATFFLYGAQGFWGSQRFSQRCPRFFGGANGFIITLSLLQQEPSVFVFRVHQHVSLCLSTDCVLRKNAQLRLSLGDGRVPPSYRKMPRLYRRCLCLLSCPLANRSGAAGAEPQSTTSRRVPQAEPQSTNRRAEVFEGANGFLRDAQCV